MEGSQIISQVSGHQSENCLHPHQSARSKERGGTVYYVSCNNVHDAACRDKAAAFRTYW